MKLDEIEAMWAEDSIMNQNDLSSEAANITRLHSKYHRELCRALMELKKLETDLSCLAKDKWLYYKGMMTREELKERSLQAFEIKLVAKEDVDRFISTDKEIILMKLKVAMADAKVDLLKSIIGMISNRNFVIKNMIDWRRFENGG